MGEISYELIIQGKFQEIVCEPAATSHPVKEVNKTHLFRRRRKHIQVIERPLVPEAAQVLVAHNLLISLHTSLPAERKTREEESA